MKLTSYTSQNKVTLVRNGEEFIQYNLDLINQAKTFIWLHTYIFEHDYITLPIITALKEKAKAGVKVYLLVDSFGSRSLSHEFIEDITFAGVEFAWFSPLISRNFHHLGRRLHSKMLLVDNVKVLMGGINHAGRFIAPQNEAPWLDYSVLLEGEEVLEFTKKNFRLYCRYFKSVRKLKELFFYVPQNKVDTHCLVQLLKNDWMRFQSNIYRSHIAEIRQAKKSITIIATYFFPGKRLLNELKLAATKGVKINLIFTDRSDHPIERWSARYLYPWFLKHQFNIFEWKKSIVHGKVILFDDFTVSIGSYNHNFISRYGNIELNINVKDLEFNSTMSKEIHNVLKECEYINHQIWQNSHHFTRKLKEALAYFFANVISFIALWLAVRKKNKDDFFTISDH